MECGTGRQTVFRLGKSLATVVAVALVGNGCTKSPEAVYSLAPEVMQLDVNIQNQTRAVLEKFYGTAQSPRWMYPAEESAAESETPPTDGKADEKKPGELKFPKLVHVKPNEWLRRGMEVYQARCASCHGVTGDGKGVAAANLDPKPRDYRKGIFKFTSTPFGSQPRRADLIRTIERGAKGTSMPAFRWMENDDLQSLVDYVILLSQRGKLEEYCVSLADDLSDAKKDLFPIKPVVEQVKNISRNWKEAEDKLVTPISKEPPFNKVSIEAGRKVFLEKECWKCHGKEGHGQQPGDLKENERAQSVDSWGNLSLAADLTSGMFHGGRRHLDIYRRIYSGINGTKMPGFYQAFEKEPETIWNLVHFVLWVSEGNEVSAEVKER